MTICITGAKGMLGRTMMGRLHNQNPTGIDIDDLDLTNPSAVDAWFAAQAPKVVVHGAAFTAVDKCEEAVDVAYAVNGQACANLARACHRHGTRLIAISTDYVFSGDATRPYHEFDEPNPQSIYGKSKLAGERAIQAHCPDHSIVRIAWLYGAGGPSFFHTMAKLGADGDAPALRVVDDQIGNPTSCAAVADLVAWLVDNPVPGVIHGTCEGETTWYGFTKAILELTGSGRGLEPCTTDEFPRPAPRPANSRLDKLVLRSVGGPTMPHWRDTLETFVRAELGN